MFSEEAEVWRGSKNVGYRTKGGKFWFYQDCREIVNKMLWNARKRSKDNRREQPPHKSFPACFGKLGLNVQVTFEN